MTYNDITHDLENITDSQKYNLDVVEKILNNLNSLRPSHFIKNTLTYDGKKFTIKQGGFLNKFLIDDIEHILEDNQGKHLKFINETLQEYFKNFDYHSKKSSTDLENLKALLTSIIKYYELNTELDFPAYFKGSEFKDGITLLRHSVDKELAKS